MSWLQQLYNTYEYCVKNPEFLEGENALLPIYHSRQQAHIEVILNAEAVMVDARLVDKEDTIIPITESSAGRSGRKDAPHPLADKLQYCAGDYAEFGGTKKPCFISYYEQLENWYKSKYNHPKVNVIFNYIKKKRLISDLIKKGILKAVNKKLLNDWSDSKTLGSTI